MDVVVFSIYEQVLEKAVESSTSSRTQKLAPFQCIIKKKDASLY